MKDITKFLCAIATVVVPALSLPASGGDTSANPFPVPPTPKSLSDVGYFDFMEAGIKELQIADKGEHYTEAEKSEIAKHIAETTLQITDDDGNGVDIAKTPIKYAHLQIVTPKPGANKGNLYQAESNAWGTWTRTVHPTLPESPGPTTISLDDFKKLKVDPIAAWKRAVDDPKLKSSHLGTSAMSEIYIFFHVGNNKPYYNFNCLSYDGGSWNFKVDMGLNVEVWRITPSPAAS